MLPVARSTVPASSATARADRESSGRTSRRREPFRSHHHGFGQRILVPHPGRGHPAIGAAQGAARPSRRARACARAECSTDRARRDSRDRARVPGRAEARRRRPREAASERFARLPERPAEIVEGAEGCGAPAMARVVAAHDPRGALERRGEDHLGAALENVAPRALLDIGFR